VLQFRARLATLRSRRDEGQGLAPDPPENTLGGQRRRGPVRPVGVGWGARGLAAGRRELEAGWSGRRPGRRTGLGRGWGRVAAAGGGAG
jgi:hypothetical protein